MANGFLSAFGLLAVTAMMICHALEERGHWFTFGFSVACLLGSTYGFLQGAWPFGIAEAIWGVTIFRKWLKMLTARSDQVEKKLNKSEENISGS